MAGASLAEHRPSASLARSRAPRARSAAGPGGSGDASLALPLGPQQGHVAGLEQLVGAHPRLPLGDADRGGDPRIGVLEDGKLLQALERASGRGGSALEVGVRQDHDELVAAVAGDAVERAKLADECLYDLSQHRVAGRVTVTIVD